MIVDLDFLQRRDFDYDDDYNCGYYDDCHYYSRWDAWGRWVALTGILIIFLLFLCCVALITSRRRRRSGIQPYYGTAWMAPPPKYAPGNDAHQFQTYPPQHHGGPPSGPYTQYYAPPAAPPYQQTGTHVAGGEQPAAPYAATHPTGSTVQTHSTGGNNPYYAPNPPAAAHVTDSKP